MPKVSLSVPHSLSQEEATQRLQEFLPRVRQHYGNHVSNVQESWNDNQLDFSFTTFGFDIAGSMLVTASQVVFNGTIPFAAMMVKGKVESAIREELGKLLS